MPALNHSEVPQRESPVAHAGLPSGVSESESDSSPPMNTSLRGRVRNTRLPKKQSLMPLFEAVVNSIHAIEDSGASNSDGVINVTVNRILQDRLSTGIPSGPSDVIGFSIEDNGIGFNTTNFESFRTLDTEYKVSKGGRGIGRLLWVKCFDRVRVSSVYEESGEKRKRIFSFDAQSGINEHRDITLSDDQPTRTMVELVGVRDSYRNICPKLRDAISNQLFEHLLQYFLRREGCPMISIRDGDVKSCLQDRFSREFEESIASQTFALKGHEFSIAHVKFRDRISSGHFIALCADGRRVDNVPLKNRVPGLFERIEDSEGEFIHGSYVMSKFLDDCVRPDREGFDILDSVGLLRESEISRDELIVMALESARVHLSENLKLSRKFSEERIHQFVSKTPNYRPILKHLDPESKIVDPSITDRELELHLHKEQQVLEHGLIEQGQNVLQVKDGEDVEHYEQRIQGFIEKITDINMSTLARYVSHRRVIIEFLAKSISSVDGNGYAREARIHQLIMPRGSDSEDVDEMRSNLWLVDERLAFHDYLASDKPLSRQPILSSESNKRPDINALKFGNNPALVSDGRLGQIPSLTIIELKCPMQNERNNPLAQTLEYLDAIRAGRVKTARGRPIPKAGDLFAYCYIIADLSSHVVQQCEQQDFAIMQDGAGYFRHFQNLRAYVEVISYDRLVSGARERNHAFFAKLGLPST